MCKDNSESLSSGPEVSSRKKRYLPKFPIQGLDKKGKILFILLFFENFFNCCAQNSLNLLSPWLAQLGGDKTFIGFFGTIPNLIQLAVLILIPGLLAKLHRLKALSIGFALLIIGNLMVFILPHSLVWISLCRVLGSLSLIFTNIMFMAMIFELAPPKTRMGAIAIFGVGGLITNPVASFLAERCLWTWGGPSIYFLSSFFSFLALLGIFLIIKLQLTSEKRPSQEATVQKTLQFWIGLPKVMFTNPKLRRLALFSILFGAALPTWMAFLPILTQQKLGVAQITSFTLPFALISIALRVGWANSLDTGSPKILLGLAFTCLALSFGLMILPLTMFSLWISGLLYGVAHSLLFPVLSSLHIKAGGAENTSAFTNAFNLENSIGSVILVPLVGLLGDHFGYPVLFGSFLVLGLFCIASLILSKD